MVDVEVVNQLVESMSDSVVALDESIKKKDYAKANELRAFIFDLHTKLTGVLGG
jgi:hypothetical protein